MAIKQDRSNTKFNRSSQGFNSQNRNQDQLNVQQIPRIWPNFASKGTRSEDSFDKFLGKWCEVSQMVNFFKQSSPSNTQWPISNIEISALNRLGSFFDRSFSLADDPLMDDIVAYKGYVCMGCLTTCIIPTYGFKETGKIVEAQHDCDWRFINNTVPYSDTNIINISNDIGYLNQKLLNQLKIIVNKWTNNEARVTAIPCPGLEITDLPSLNEESHSWAKRTLPTGESILSDLELLDFLRTSGNKTYGLFNLKSEDKNGSYFMCMHPKMLNLVEMV